MKSSCLLGLTIIIAVATTTSNAATISVTDWRTYKNSPATTLAGQSSDDPVIGSTAATAAGSFLLGYLPQAASLGINAGDSVKLTFGVHFNDAAGMSNGGDNFRFALFDLNNELQDSATGDGSGGPNYTPQGTTNTNNFRGYWFGVRNGSGTGSGGSIRERNAALTASDSPFTNTGGDPAPTLGPVGGQAVTLVSDVNGNGAGADYLGVMTLTRNSLGGIDLTGSFKGSNSANANSFSATDSTPNASSFGAVAFLIGGGLSADQAIFTDVTVVAVPEPASWLLGTFLLMAGAVVRRRA